MPARTKPRRGRLSRIVRAPFRPGWRSGLAAGLIAATGFILSYPPFSLWPAAILSIWPLLWLADAASRRERVWASALWAGLGTLPAWIWLTRWAAEGAPAGFPILVAYLALFAGLAVWLTARLRRRLPLVLIAPVVWMGLEFLRGHVLFDGFPWFLAGHPLIDGRSVAGATLAWPAAFFGTYFVSGLLALAAAWIDSVVRGARPVRALVIAGLILAGWLGAPAGVLRESGGPAVRIGVVQTNVPQSLREGWSTERRWEDWLSMRDLLARAADVEPPPDVLVVPETMFPGFVLQEDAARAEREAGVAWSIGPDPATGEPRHIRAERVREGLLELQETLGIPMLVGASGFEGFRIDRQGRTMLYEFEARYNSVFLIEDGRVRELRYDKRHLTPFGEVMPYISNWPWLEQRLLALAAQGMAFDLEAGERPVVFEIPIAGGRQVRLATPICFEATTPGVCRDLVFGRMGRRAGLLVNLTNDGWFYGAEGGRELHLLAARWRCVELATPMVRAANSGISAAIDARGRIGSALEPWTEGVLPAEVATGDRGTVYATIGESSGWAALGLTILGWLATYTPWGRGNRTETDEPDEEGTGTDREGSS